MSERIYRRSRLDDDTCDGYAEHPYDFEVPILPMPRRRPKTTDEEAGQNQPGEAVGRLAFETAQAAIKAQMEGLA